MQLREKLIVVAAFRRAGVAQSARGQQFADGADRKADRGFVFEKSEAGGAPDVDEHGGVGADSDVPDREEAKLPRLEVEEEVADWSDAAFSIPEVPREEAAGGTQVPGGECEGGLK